MRESALELYFVDLVKEAGGITYKWVSPGNSGVPDRLVLFPGGLVFMVELKTSGGYLRTLQKVQRDRLFKYGFTVVVLKDKINIKAWVDTTALAAKFRQKAAAL